jgi:hypothetical protein
MLYREVSRFIRELRRCRRGAGEAIALPVLAEKFLVKGRRLRLMFPQLIKKPLQPGLQT